MDSLDLIRAFREVATHGNFSRAATRLGISKATVSKYVAELESRFGVRLLNRSTRSVSLTDAGELLLERSAPMLEMVELTLAELDERANQPRGRLRIAAPHAMGGGGALPTLLAEFMGFYPEVQISLHLANHVDLAEDAIDVELRFGPIENENLIVRKLLQIPMVVCAAPSYWDKHGIPQHPSELGEHDALTLIRETARPVWRFEEKGKRLDVPVNSRMEATEASALIEVARHGFGVVYVPSMAVQPHIDQGQLVPVLQPFTRQDMWVSAAYLHRRHNSAALRALLDYLQDRARGQGRFAGSTALPVTPDAPPIEGPNKARLNRPTPPGLRERIVRLPPSQAMPHRRSDCLNREEGCACRPSAHSAPPIFNPRAARRMQAFARAPTARQRRRKSRADRS